MYGSAYILTYVYIQRYQDNLEFMQWLKRFFEINVQSMGEYDPIAQRLRGKGSSIRLCCYIKKNRTNELLFLVRWG